MAFPPRLMDNVLPSNAFEYERTLASEVERLLALDASEIRNLWNPWTCRADLLPYLAWALSVDLWDPNWPVDKQRSVIANAIRHHRLKGTLAGIENYVELVGGKVVKAVTPPSKMFSGPSLTREQREAWLVRLPQVRVWRQRERSFRPFAIFSGGARHRNFIETRYPHPNDAIVRLRRRARWVVNDQETTTRVEEFESYFRIFIPGHRPRSVFSNTIPGKRFYQPSTAASRIVTIEPLSLSPWRNAIGPRLTPVTSEPELVAQKGREGVAVFAGRTFGGRFYQPSTAGFRLFERYAVLDGSSGPAKRPSIQFMGVGRYGIKPKTAELTIKMRIRKKPWQAGEGIVTPKSRFWIPHNPEPMNNLRKAVKASKRLTDKILIDTNTKTGFVAGLPFWAGDEYLA